MKTQLKIDGTQKKRSKREIHSNTELLQQTRNTSNKQSKLTPEANSGRTKHKGQREYKQRNSKEQRGNEQNRV